MGGMGGKELSSTVVEAIDKLEREGFAIAYTDGSSRKVYGIGWVGGYGFFCCF